MTTLCRSLMPSLRRLAAQPGFTAVAVLTLAVAIGANTAVFTVVNGVLLRSLPYPDAGRLVTLWHSAPGIGINQIEQSQGTYTTYHESNRTFTDVGLYANGDFTLTGTGEAVRVVGSRVSRSLFSVLQCQPELGRVWDESSEKQGGTPMALISHSLWAQRFSSDRHILGKLLRVDGVAYQISGVMPAGFHFPRRETQVWMPYIIDPAQLGAASFNVDAIGRLKPGVSLKSADADLNELLYQVPERHPGSLTRKLMEQAHMKAYVIPLREQIVGDVERALWILMGAVLFLLLIACANLANIMLVRMDSQHKEIAIRSALGAGRRDLFQLFFGEAGILALAGGAGGLLLAWLGIRLLLQLNPGNIPRLDEISMDWRVLLFTGGVVFLTALAFGVFPVFRFWRPSLVRALNEGGRSGGTSRRSNRLRHVLLGCQVALALVLLVGSGLMAKTFLNLARVPLGFNNHGVLTLQLSLPGKQYKSAESAWRFYRNVLDRLRALPGVTAAGAISDLPLTGAGDNDGLRVKDHPVAEGNLPPVIKTRWVAPGYFKSMGIQLLQGRPFENSDLDNQQGVVMVSASLARQFWPRGDAIGKQIEPWNPGKLDPWYTIIGVVSDIHDLSLKGSGEKMVYYPIQSVKGASDPIIPLTMNLTIRSDIPPDRQVRSVRTIVNELDSNLPIANVRTIGEIVSHSMARTVFTLILLAIASAMALLLGIVGIYGVVSYVVSQRTREIGVRIALGAQSADVKRLFVVIALKVTTVGIMAGLLGTFFLSRSLQGLLFRTSALDPWTYAGVTLVLLTVAALASYIPARRASRIEPTEALRFE